MLVNFGGILHWNLYYYSVFQICSFWKLICIKYEQKIYLNESICSIKIWIHSKGCIHGSRRPYLVIRLQVSIPCQGHVLVRSNRRAELLAWRAWFVGSLRVMDGLLQLTDSRDNVAVFTINASQEQYKFPHSSTNEYNVFDSSQTVMLQTFSLCRKNVHIATVL